MNKADLLEIIKNTTFEPRVLISVPGYYAIRWYPRGALDELGEMDKIMINGLFRSIEGESIIKDAEVQFLSGERAETRMLDLQRILESIIKRREHELGTDLKGELIERIEMYRE